jgi:hypothetical protein
MANLNLNLVLPFLEQRDYLHGTTLFEQLRPLAPPAAETCFRILRQIRTNTIRVASLERVDDPIARLDWTEGGKTQTLAVEELPIHPPIERNSYNEILVTAVCRIDGHNVHLEGNTPFDPVANAVPMFKAALKANGYTPDAGGQWMFTRLDSIAVGPDSEQMELRLILARQRVVAKAEILVGGTRYADMYFSWVS